MKEIRIEARARNNILFHAIFDKWGSVSAFCREYNFTQSTVGDLLNLKISPLQKRKNEYREFCVRLATALRFVPEELFPLELYKIERPQRVYEISFAQLPSMMALKQLPAPSDPEKELINEEFKVALSAVLATLRPREVVVIKYLYGLDGFDEISANEVAILMDLSSTRVGQIKQKALRKLRHPSRIKMLDIK
jgi:RNA polymerase sigma factor (sigma-70 family)